MSFCNVRQQEADLRTANQVLQQGVSIFAHMCIEFGDSILSMHNLLMNTHVFPVLYITSALLHLHSRSTHRLVLCYKASKTELTCSLSKKACSSSIEFQGMSSAAKFLSLMTFSNLSLNTADFSHNSGSNFKALHGKVCFCCSGCLLKASVLLLGSCEPETGSNRAASFSSCPPRYGLSWFVSASSGSSECDRGSGKFVFRPGGCEGDSPSDGKSLQRTTDG